MIDFKCPNCGEEMRVPSSLIGKTEKCPGCGNTITVLLTLDSQPKNESEACKDGYEWGSSHHHKGGDDPLRDEKPPCKEGPEGIAGWLILPAIGLVLGPIGIIYSLFLSFMMFGGGVLDDLSSEYPGASAAIIGQQRIQIVFLWCVIWVAVLFFCKKRITPKAFIALLTANLIISIIIESWNSSVFWEPFEIGDIIKSIVGCAIWIPYFLVSKRVKNTFTH